MDNIYYELYNDFDPEITGIKQGVQQGKIDGKLFKDQIWLNEFLYGEDAGLRRGNFPERDFKLLNIWLDKKSKITDFISVGVLPTGFIINEKVKQILQGSCLPPHKFYPVSYNQSGNTIEEYYWFYFNLYDGQQYVNFEKSIFDTSAEEKIYSQKFNITNYQDYINLTLKTGSAVDTKRIVFNKDFNSNIDLFGMRFLGSRDYISNRLYNRFLECKITGIEAIPINSPILEWE